MSDFSVDKITILEKENRKVRQQLKILNERYKALKLKNAQMEEESYKEKALPAHYQTIEQDYFQLQEHAQQLIHENRQLKEQNPNLRDTSTLELEKQLKLSQKKIQELEKQNQKMHVDLRNSKTEIAEVLIDARRRVRQNSEDVAVNHTQLEERLKKELSDLRHGLQISKQQIDSLVNQLSVAIDSTVN